MTKSELIKSMEGVSDDTKVVIGNPPNEIMEYSLSDIEDVIVYKPGKKYHNGLIVIDSD